MIILLNGTSSAGKTTLARSLQDRYAGVLLLYGVDTMVQGAFPEKCDLPPWNEQAIRVEMTEVEGVPQVRLDVSSYMIPVYRSAVAFYRELSAIRGLMISLHRRCQSACMTRGWLWRWIVISGTRRRLMRSSCIASLREFIY